MDLEGRHVVVTGAGRGIGRALALRFADEGARAVVVSDLDEANARQVAPRRSAGSRSPPTSAASRTSASSSPSAEAANGPIDLFFSNAGITGPSGGPEILDADWDLLWRVNTMSHVWAARALLPGMLERGEGYLPAPRRPPACSPSSARSATRSPSTRAVALAEWLSMTYGDRGIRVSCLCPQYVRTPMVTDGELPVEKLEQVATILEPEQVADAVVEAIREERLLILPHPEVAHLHGPPRRRPRAVAAGNAPVAGISSGLVRTADGALTARQFPPGGPAWSRAITSGSTAVGGRYDQLTEQLRYVIVCDACEAEVRELERSGVPPAVHAAGAARSRVESRRWTPAWRCSPRTTPSAPAHSPRWSRSAGTGRCGSRSTRTSRRAARRPTPAAVSCRAATRTATTCSSR